jgi:predicted membrane protein
MWLLAVLLLICVVLAIIGAVKLNKKGTVSGTLLVIAAVLSAMTIYGIIAAICFVISGIFAFVSDKRSILQDKEEIKDSSEEYDLGL